LKKAEDAFYKIRVPDVCPNEVLNADEDNDFSMIAGEFI
jgi:hypothetical protein